MQEQIFISGPQEEALAFGRKGEEVSRVQTLVRLCPGKPVLGSFPLPTPLGAAHDSYEATLKKKENQVGFKALHRAFPAEGIGIFALQLPFAQTVRKSSNK